MRIRGQHAIDLAHLPWTQILMRIEAPAAGEQSLAPQDLVDPGDAAHELVDGIEERRVKVGQFGAERQELQNLLAWVTRGLATRNRQTPSKQFDRILRPDRPLPQEAAGKVQSSWKRRQQISDDRVVVPCIQRDVAPSALSQGHGDIQRAIPIEGSDLDRHNAFDLEEFAPERAIEDASTDRRLQVKPHDRYDVRHAPAMIQYTFVVLVAQRREAQQRRVVSE